MKTISYKIIVTCGILSLFTSCNKFLGVEPKGQVLLKTVTDFDLLLNSQALTSSGEQLLNVMTDEADVPTIDPLVRSTSNLSYLWADQLNPTTTEKPLIWGNHYANIYTFNAVINQVENASSGTDLEKKRIKAESLLGRAFEYSYLVNLYAKPYQESTANTDLSVPFITSTDIMTATPPRISTALIINQITKDIKDAIPYLPSNNNTNKFRGSVNAAYSVLARIYYYTSNYAEANKYANLALNETGTGLLDFNGYTIKTAIPYMVYNKQEIYSRYGTNSSQSVYPDLNFLKLFNKADLRLKLFYTNLGDFSFPKRGKTQYSPSGSVVNFGTSVAEMKLIVAEIAARNNNLQLALDQMNEIRKNRTATASYQPFTSTDQETVLKRVLLERRFELAFKGLRWMDMRKQDLENRMDVVNRLNAKGDVISTLDKHSSKYTLKIPASVLNFNPDMPQN